MDTFTLWFLYKCGFMHQRIRWKCQILILCQIKTTISSSLFNDNQNLYFDHPMKEVWLWSKKGLDVVFSRFRGFSFTITLRKKPKGVTRISVEQLSLSLCFVIQRRMCGIPLGVYLKKTTPSVLSVLLLIYGV